MLSLPGPQAPRLPLHLHKRLLFPQEKQVDIVALDIETALNGTMNLLFRYQMWDTISENATLKCPDISLRKKNKSQKFLFE